MVAARQRFGEGLQSSREAAGCPEREAPLDPVGGIGRTRHAQGRVQYKHAGVRETPRPRAGRHAAAKRCRPHHRRSRRRSQAQPLLFEKGAQAWHEVLRADVR